MMHSSNRQRRAIAAAAAAFMTQAGWAQEGAAPVVVVTGKRASMMSAQDIKRDSADIIDAMVADEIHKLPDTSVTDALQRITGVQVLRDRGEGAGVAIRGLTQMENTLNGREVFTAGSGRNVDFADYPSEMVSRIQVYKTGSAERIEGGVGGAIDLRTRRPFDFKGREVVGSARMIHGDLVKDAQPQFSLLASERWSGAGGQFGALVNLVHQKRAWREDQKTVSPPVARSDLLAGQTVAAPGGISETTSLGKRERDAASLILEWRPAPGLELYAEASYARFLTLQDSYQINVSASPTFVAGSPVLFPGTADIQAVTWTNAPLSVLSFARDTVDRNRQAALGGSWRAGPWSFKGDVSHTNSSNTLFFSGPFMAASVASFSQDVSSRVPGSVVSGTNLLDPANLRYTGVAYRARPFDGKLDAAQADAEYRFGEGFFDTLSAGLRYARRGAGNAPNLVFGDTTVSLPASAVPGASRPNPYPNIFPGEGVPGIGSYLVGNLAAARDAAALRAAFGITAPLPTIGNPLGVWEINETTQSAYVQTTFKSGRLPLDGNAGVRAVRTRESVAGMRTNPSDAATPVPIDVDSTYTDYLPSLNLRYRAAEGVYVRAAASKTITRPNFNELSPSLTLLPNPVTPANNQGAAGNPDLKPVRSDNLDLALEKYGANGTALTATAFLKRVDGFVSNVARPETHDGVQYQVTRPQNGLAARIKGVELGYLQFFDFVPVLRGYGLQANYTFVDSDTPHVTLGNIPLQNLSRNSANLIGIYENERISVRLAGNWRSKFLSSFSTVVGSTQPVYTRGYGWLDASLTCRVGKHLSVAFEGSNLLRTVRSAYYGVETRPQGALLNDRQFSASVTMSY